MCLYIPLGPLDLIRFVCEKVAFPRGVKVQGSVVLATLESQAQVYVDTV